VSIALDSAIFICLLYINRFSRLYAVKKAQFLVLPISFLASYASIDVDNWWLGAGIYAWRTIPRDHMGYFHYSSSIQSHLYNVEQQE
jgi:hypothetical protein